MSSLQSGRGRSYLRATSAAVLGTVLLGGYVSQSLAKDEALEEVTITGTRIKHKTDFDTANPTTVLDAEYFRNSGVVNVGDAVKLLPSNVSTFAPTNTGNSNFFAGSTIANLRGLNPFFGSRTLNLVNGRRFVPTNQGDGLDLNFIPSILIERMDVVTGGASAVYGSGAIAGVDNIFLNRTLQGTRVDADYGESAHGGDAKNRHVAVAFGTGFAGERGHVVIGYEHEQLDQLGCVNARDWCAKGVGFRQNDPASIAAGGPAFVLAGNLHQAQISDAGVFENFGAAFGAPVLGVDAAGTGTVPFNVGTGDPTLPFNAVTGGDGRSVYAYTNLRSPLKRDVGAITFTYKLTDTLNLSIDGSLGTVKTDQSSGALDVDLGIIQPDNAYLTPALAAAQAASALFPGGFAFFNKDWTSQTNPHSAFDTDVKRIAAGLDGAFGSSSWTWDGYYQYGKTHRTQLVADNRHLNAYNFAVDAVIDNRVGSPTFGQPVCRVTRDGTAGLDAHTALIAQGCVPLNSFGTGPISAAAKAYAWGYLQETLDTEQHVVAFNTTGDLAAGWGAGAIKGAAGVEYRKEKGSNIDSQGDAPEWVKNDYLIQYGNTFAGTVDVYEGYVETNIPVASDVTGAQKLEFDLALRESHYKNKGGEGTSGESSSHNLTTWKISGIWDPVTWLRVRGSQSRDARSANFRELYYQQIIWAGGAFGFCRPFPDQSDPCTWSLEGNTKLQPETSDTTTVGLVFTPTEHLSGFQFAADYFHIKIKDAIQQASVTRVLDGCRVSGIQEFCDLITFDPNNPIPVPPGATYGPAQSNVVTVRALAFNGAAYTFSGIDFTGTYAFKMGAAGDMNLRLLATKMLEQKFQPTPEQPYVDVVGQTGNSNTFLSDNQPTADWLATFSATWAKNAWTATVQARYVSSGIQDYNAAVPPATPLVAGRTVDTNSVPSYTVFGLNGSYMFSDLGFVKSVQIWGGVDNLFDKDPPPVGGVGPFGLSNANGGANPIFYDTIGRYYKLGLRAEF